MSDVKGKGPRATGIDRRRVIAAGAAVCLGSTMASSGVFADDNAADLPGKGDHLIPGDGDAKSPPLTADSIKVGGPLVEALAVTPAGVVKNSTRFTKLLLFRFDPKDIEASVRPMTVDGVMAFSAICTHQGCELSAWDPSTEILQCFCHGSEFRPEKGGEVAHGPAVKQLPMLPLVKGDGGKLMVADGFTASPGPPQKTRL